MQGATGFQSILRTLAVCAVSAVAMLYTSAMASAQSELPDLLPWKDVGNQYMYAGYTVANQVPGKTVYRFNFPMANIGTGPLELRETTDAAGTQTIYQRIFDIEGDLVEERVVGEFPHANPPYGHFFLEGIAHYRIREVLPGDGVGDILTTHEKISYALVDTAAYNLSLPNAPPTKHYNAVMLPYVGVSVGWADLYSASLPGQWADITGLAAGEYWLEAEIDPFNRILEANETNNIDRVKININPSPPTILAGDYDRDGIVNAADYTVWRNTLGNKVTQGTGADGDGSGRIGVPDYEVWRDNYGATSPGAGGITAPEPASVALASVTILACGLANRRPRRTVAAPSP